MGEKEVICAILTCVEFVLENLPTRVWFPESENRHGNFMDPIADMLIMLKNASMARKEMVAVSYSQLKMEIAKVLEKKGFIKEASHKGKKNKKIIEIILTYREDGTPAIIGIKKVSKLSKRVYLPVKKIKKTKQGFGIQIISTPKGILTDEEARKEKVGGEVLCEIW